MPLPVQSDLHVNQLLTNVLVAYLQQERKFVHRRVFPRVPVQKQSDIIPQWDRADMLRNEVRRRGPGSQYPRVGIRNDNSLTYRCDTRGLEFPVDDEQVANQDDPYDMNAAAARYLGQQKMLEGEVDWVTSYFTTGVWTGSTTGTDLTGGADFTVWSDDASTPIDDVKEQARNVESATGFYPNTLVVSRSVFDHLAEHPDIVDRTGHHTDRVTTPSQIARLLFSSEETMDGTPVQGRMLITSAVRNSAEEGLSISADYIAGDHALLCYTPPQPGLYVPSAGYTFEWTGATPAGANAIFTYRDETVESDVHRVKMSWDNKVIAAFLGVFFASAVS